MRHEPESLPHPILIETLHRHWDLQVTDLTYAPLGFGSHHWTATCEDGSKRWVTADDLTSTAAPNGDTPDERFKGLRAALATAIALQNANLEFVLAPLTTITNSPIARITTEWSLAVYPFVDGEALGAGHWDGVSGSAEAARLVGRLHLAAPPPGIPKWQTDLKYLEELREAQEDGRPWRSGPYAEKTRLLLAEYRVRFEGTLARYKVLVEHIRSLDDPWVVTHGEPHSANFLRSTNGEPFLIDWDTVRLAPRERDLAFEGEALQAYWDDAGRPRVRQEARELFNLLWTLEEVCTYAHQFRQPHTGTEDDHQSWENLQDELEKLRT